MLLLLLTLTLQAADPTREQLDFFENEIRPLLIKHCYECHSDTKLEGELRVNGRAALLHGGASGPAVILGKPKESLMIEAVEYRSLEMPPNGKLPQSDISKFIHWIEMGLPWPKEEDGATAVEMKGKTFHISDEQRNHWAFQPITNPAPPVVSNKDWNRNPIDQFIYSSLKSQGLEPNGPASREKLLRRITYDLTGLPPTPEELQQFLDDHSPDAWDNVIDRLLASPHYGERWGRHWLDVVRYADTSGNASDHPVADAYKYRNYVIDSFNNDKPYDQFLREQYAGDLLANEAPPEQYAELVTATGHLAIARRFGFNDTNFLDFHLTMQDLLDTMGQSVLGLNIGCARCHDHKFEPISARDYYALYGIFSSTVFTFPGAEEVRQPKNLIPLIPLEEARQRELERNQQLGALDQSLVEKSFLPLNLEGAFEVEEKLPSLMRFDKEARLTSDSQSPFRNVFPAGKQVIELPRSEMNLGFRRSAPFSNKQTTDPLYINVDFRNVREEMGGSGYYRICLDHQTNFSPAVELFVNGTSIAVRDGSSLREVAPIQYGAWYNLQLAVNWKTKTFSGTVSGEKESWSFTEVPFNPKWDGTVDSFVIDGHGTDSAQVRPLRQFDNLSVDTTPFPAANEVTSQTAENLQQQLQLELEKYQKLREEINNTKKGLASQPPYPTAYAVREGTPANVRMHMRGEPSRLGEEIPRGFLEILGGETIPETLQESGRRQLAEWLAAPTNPLTARVIVNRVWQHHFGRGIVATPNDFGTRGEPPSHPELLDYLATQFIHHHWSFKELHREILRSQTYQLSSAVNTESLQADPTNRWLWRYSRQRLDAESLRDSILLISGDLDVTPGGPHPFPAVESWRYSQHNPFDAVYESSRRSVYLMTQRIKRHPYLALFDGADPNATTGQRDATITPSQALFLMNDSFTHAQSLKTAKRLMSRFSEDSERIRFLYQWVYSRNPTESEEQAAFQFLNSYSQMLPNDPERITSAWAAYVRAIFSSNEFLHVD